MLIFPRSLEFIRKFHCIGTSCNWIKPGLEFSHIFHQRLDIGFWHLYVNVHPRIGWGSFISSGLIMKTLSTFRPAGDSADYPSSPRRKLLHMLPALIPERCESCTKHDKVQEQALNPASCQHYRWAQEKSQWAFSEHGSKYVNMNMGNCVFYCKQCALFFFITY